MAGITLAVAEAHLAAWLQADLDLATKGESAAVKGRALKRSDASMVKAQVDYWDQKCQALSGADGGGVVLMRAVRGA